MWSETPFFPNHMNNYSESDLGQNISQVRKFVLIYVPGNSFISPRRQHNTDNDQKDFLTSQFMFRAEGSPLGEEKLLCFFILNLQSSIKDL